MQVFVQMVSRCLLLETDPVWVESREEAREFSNPRAAINYCVSHGIEGARLLLSFGDSKLDLYVDVFGVEKRSLAAANPQLKTHGREKDRPHTCWVRAKRPPSHVGGYGMERTRSWYRDHFAGLMADA